MRRAARKLVVVTTVMAMLAAMPLAFAGPPSESGVVTRAPDASGFVYTGDGVHVLTGPVELAEGCAGEGFSTPTALYVDRPNGTNSHHFDVIEGIAVFDDMGIDDVFEWLDMACGAIFDGDPTTIAPEPLAVGEGKVSFHFRMDHDGIVHIHNNVRGKVWTTDGKQVHLSAYAQLEEGPDYLNVGQLRVNYGGN